MADNFDKDPFAEYDKYWDELDQKEEDVKKKQRKEYRFDHQKPAGIQRQNKLIAYIVFGFIAFVFLGIFLSIARMTTSGMGMTFTSIFLWPFTMLSSAGPIIFIIVIVAIIRKSKKG